MWFVWLIGGVVVGFAVGYAGARSSLRQAQGTKSPGTSMGGKILPNPEQTEETLRQAQGPNKEQAEERQKRLGMIEEYLSTHEEVTNQEVAKMLGVDDSTVVRYLDELEKQGKLVQVGTTGRSVTYKKT